MPNLNLKKGAPEAQPEEEPSHVTQEMAQLIEMPGLGLDTSVCRRIVPALNVILAETIQLRDLLKKAHWQVQGPAFIALHELFDAHYDVQAKFADMVAERVQTLGGVAVAQGANAGRLSTLTPVPAGRECPDAQLSGLLDAHAGILSKCRKLAKLAEELGDYATADLMVTDLIREGEKQCWFLSSHLTPPCKE
jgi:starvation-inducible DNA-binding protein